MCEQQGKANAMTKRKAKPPATKTPAEPHHEPLEFFQGGIFHTGGWHWRITHQNGNILCVGSESYVTKAGAVQGFRASQKIMSGIKLP